MPFKTESILANAFSGLFIVKNWVLLNIGIDVSPAFSIHGIPQDIVLAWIVGFSLFVFNVVKIVKYIKDIRRP